MRLSFYAGLAIFTYSAIQVAQAVGLNDYEQQLNAA